MYMNEEKYLREAARWKTSMRARKEEKDSAKSKSSQDTVDLMDMDELFGCKSVHTLEQMLDGKKDLETESKLDVSVEYE